MLRFFSLTGKGFFWIWNIIMLLFSICILVPFILLPLIASMGSGWIPLSVALSIVGMVLLPVIGIAAYVRWGLDVNKLFFGVQLPIFTLLWMRMGLFRDLTWSTGLMVLIGLLACGFYAYLLWRETKETAAHSVWQARIETLFAPILALVGITTGLLALVHIIPIAAEMMEGISRSLFRMSMNEWLDLLTSLVMLIVLLTVFTTMVVYAVFPFYIGALFPRAWLVVKHRVRAFVSPQAFFGASLFVGLGLLALHHQAVSASGDKFVEQLETMSPSEQAALIADQPDYVQNKLLDAYLYRYRHFATPSTAKKLARHYNRQFDIDGSFPQAISNYILGPFLYKGRMNDDVQAGKLYQSLFDRSIQRDHKRPIARALSATFDRDEADAGLMNIGYKNVLLQEQKLHIDDQGDYAVIDIEESYRNLTGEQQEVFYYFSMPEDAVLNGIWLGSTRERSKMDRYIVAPRGAAQEVYERSVQQRIDPALLEQVGPQQYRLRIFPIPESWRDGGREPDKLMRMYMRIVVPRSDEGFRLPQLLEKRNIDWDRRTQRFVGDARQKKAFHWLPVSVPAKQTGPLKPLSVTLNDQIISASLETPKMPEGQKIAVIIDRSFSMGEHKKALSHSLEALNVWAETSGSHLSIFDAQATQDTLTAFDASTPYFGQITYPDIIQKLGGLTQDNDAVLILTDQGTYGSADETLPLSLNKPLWFIHHGRHAFAYDDNVLDLIYETGGGVADSVYRWQHKYAARKEGANAGENYIWRKIPATSDHQNTTLKGLQALGARQLIQFEAFGKKPDNATLDSLHALAKTHAVVTPYSSMIVLVNDAQRRALEEASKDEDRFDREGRSGEEALTAPNVSGVPEPHEWLLIFICLFLMMWVWKNKERYDYA